MPITDPSEEYFKDGTWGWNGTDWVKLPIVFGYYERWAEDLGETKSGAGAFVSASTAVPAGEVWVLQCLHVRNETGARGAVTMFLMGGVDWSACAYVVAPGQGAPVLFQGPVTLREGDSLYVQQLACQDADVIRSAAWGYKMKVA